MRPLAALAFALLAAASFAAHAAGLAILIQTEPGGQYRYWYNDGATHLSSDELVDLWASALPGGGQPQETSAGPARAFETPRGIVVELAAAAADKALLLDRDDCGAVKVWHSGGSHALSEDQIADLLINALPEGGKPIAVGGQLAKSYLTKLGVVVVQWKPAKGVMAPKPPSSAK